MTRQAYRDGNALPFVETLLQDLRYTLRQLRKNPGFTSIAILVLTLGIGATVALFSFADAALIRHCPIVSHRGWLLFRQHSVGPKFHLSFPDYYIKKFIKFSARSMSMTRGLMLATPTGAHRRWEAA